MKIDKSFSPLDLVLACILLLFISFNTFISVNGFFHLNSSGLSRTHIPLVFIVVIMLYFYITNKRRLIGVVNWIILITLITVPYLVLFLDNNITFQNIRIIRNVIYELGLGWLIFIVVLHLVVHGSAWIVKRKRQVFTKVGILSLIIASLSFFLITTFSLPILNFFFTSIK